MLVDVTAEYQDAVQRMFDDSTRGEWLGRGRDHDREGKTSSKKGNDPAYTRLEVVGVRRVQNKTLLRKYGASLGALSADLAASGRPVPKISLPADNAISQLPECSILSTAANEKLVFHGCDADTAGVISRSGFDARVSRPGMFSSGSTSVYFAAHASKADEYATGSANEPYVRCI